MFDDQFWSRMDAEMQALEKAFGAAPLVEGSHASVSEACRIQALRHLDTLKQNIDLQVAAIRFHPDNKELLDNLIAGFIVEERLYAASLEQFQNLRECVGAA